MKIIFMRHGETVWNTQRRLQGCLNIPLAEQGMAQIQQTGDHLAELKLHIDQILSSPLDRALESAKIIANILNFPAGNILTSDLFIERSFGDCEGMIYEEAQKQYPEGNYPGMETLDELYARTKLALTFLEEHFAGQTVFVASHGSFIKAMLGTASNGKVAYFDENIWVENGSYCLLEKSNDTWKVSVYSQSTNFAAQVIS